MSLGVAVERTDGIDVQLSGLAAPKATLTDETRAIFELIEEIFVEDLDGRLADVCTLRVYLPELTPQRRSTIHAVRREFFEAPAYPAATMIEVSALAVEDASVEIEAEGFVPDEPRTIETITAEE